MQTFEEHEAEILSNAVYYGVSLFLGSGQYDKHTCRTLDEARDIGSKMVAHHKNGRKPIIYAYDKLNRFALITK